jgi:glycolate oxidase FAD binding subunit
VSGVSNATGVEREMRAICGEKYVSEGASVLRNFPPHPGHQVLVVTPGSAEEVAAVLQFANAHGLSVVPEGGMTAGCVMAESDIVLQASRLVEVEHYDHADLTVGVGAGTTVAQLSAMVAEDSLVFACDPPFPERASIGGVLATASHGPLRHGYGALRDFCIGIRFVTGDGRRAKGGGRVVKNVAGYDLMKLLIGSYGTLAVITSASFKLFPAPRQTRTFLAEFGTAPEALQFRDLVMRSPLSPMCLELVSPGARKSMRPEMTSDAWVICVRASGSNTVLARYRKELGAAISRELEGEDENRMWRAIADFPATPLTDNSVALGTCLSIFVPPADVALILKILQDHSRPELTNIAFVGRVGVGHLLVSFRLIDMELTDNVFADGLIAALPQSAHVRSGVFGAGTRAEPAQSDSMHAVKQALDPRNVLRGRKVF